MSSTGIRDEEDTDYRIRKNELDRWSDKVEDMKILENFQTVATIGGGGGAVVSTGGDVEKWAEFPAVQTVEPELTNSFSLGSLTKYWQEVYANIFYIAGAANSIFFNSGALNFSVGETSQIHLNVGSTEVAKFRLDGVGSSISEFGNVIATSLRTENIFTNKIQSIFSAANNIEFSTNSLSRPDLDFKLGSNGRFFFKIDDDIELFLTRSTLSIENKLLDEVGDISFHYDHSIEPSDEDFIIRSKTGTRTKIFAGTTMLAEFYLDAANSSIASLGHILAESINTSNIITNRIEAINSSKSKIEFVDGSFGDKDLDFDLTGNTRFTFRINNNIELFLTRSTLSIENKTLDNVGEISFHHDHSIESGGDNLIIRSGTGDGTLIFSGTRELAAFYTSVVDGATRVNALVNGDVFADSLLSDTLFTSLIRPRNNNADLVFNLPNSARNYLFDVNGNTQLSIAAGLISIQNNEIANINAIGLDGGHRIDQTAGELRVTAATNRNIRLRATVINLESLIGTSQTLVIRNIDTTGGGIDVATSNNLNVRAGDSLVLQAGSGNSDRIRANSDLVFLSTSTIDFTRLGNSVPATPTGSTPQGSVYIRVNGNRKRIRYWDD